MDARNSIRKRRGKNERKKLFSGDRLSNKWKMFKLYSAWKRGWRAGSGGVGKSGKSKHTFFSLFISRMGIVIVESVCECDCLSRACHSTGASVTRPGAPSHAVGHGWPPHRCPHPVRALFRPVTVNLSVFTFKFIFNSYQILQTCRLLNGQKQKYREHVL